MFARQVFAAQGIHGFHISSLRLEQERILSFLFPYLLLPNASLRTQNGTLVNQVLNMTLDLCRRKETTSHALVGDGRFDDPAVAFKVFQNGGAFVYSAVCVHS